MAINKEILKLCEKLLTSIQTVTESKDPSISVNHLIEHATILVKCIAGKELDEINRCNALIDRIFLMLDRFSA